MKEIEKFLAQKKVIVRGWKIIIDAIKNANLKQNELDCVKVALGLELDYKIRKKS